MAGATVTAQSLNDRIGAICTNIDKTLDAHENFKKWCDARTGTTIASELEISEDDANLIKSAVGELASLRASWDALTFVHQLTGIGSQGIVPL